MFLSVRITKINLIKQNYKVAKQFSYKPQYGVIVICETEEEQIKVFEELKEKGFKLRIVTT